MVENDEAEIEVEVGPPSKDGPKIRKALRCTTIRDVVQSAIDQKLPGHTLIWNEHNCYILEAMENEKKGRKHYRYKVEKLQNDQCLARTNHGILIPEAGYQRLSNDQGQTHSRISSESRLKIAEYVIQRASTPQDAMDDLTKIYTDEPQLNSLRTAGRGKMMRTTSQLMIIPSQKTMYVRPIQSNLNFNFWDHNSAKNQLWVELTSNRVLFDNLRSLTSNMSHPKLDHKSK
jgi:hypothetical protein